MDEHKKAELKWIVASNPDLAEICSKAVAQYLDGLPSGERVAFYGCGNLSRVLIENHAPSLKRLSAHFMITNPDGTDDFHGFPKYSLRDVKHCPPDRVVIMSYVFQAEMSKNLEFMGPDRGMILTQVIDGADHESLLNEVLAALTEHLKPHLERLDALCKRGSPVVCFATHMAAHHLLKTMREVHKRGYSIILVVEHAKITDTIFLKEFEGQGYFDYLYESKYSYSLELLEILKRCPINLVHAEAGMWSSLPLAHLMKEKPCPIAVEYRDFKQTVFADDAIAMETLKLLPEDYNREREAQKNIYTLADGIIYKDSPEVIGYLKREYDYVPKKQLQFMHYCSHDFFAEEDCIRKLSHYDSRFHIVYAGNLVNNPQWHNYPIFSSLFEAARTLADQGIHFAIYNANDSTGRGFEEYIRLADELELFDYHFAVPYNKLKSVLPCYDFGWFCFDFSKATENPLFLRTTMGSKIFSYLEAGLPVLVSPEQAYIKRVVLDIGIGIELRFDELEWLGRILQERDWHEIFDNIQRARQVYTYEQQSSRLINFYRSLTDSSYQPLSSKRRIEV
ncbi:MAG: hypothetical protein ABIF87_06630 [Pseudomonadota bacterium]